MNDHLAPESLRPAPPVETEEGPLETAVSVLTRPVPTLRRVTQLAPVGWAIGLVAVLQFLSGIAAGLATPAFEGILGPSPDMGAVSVVALGIFSSIAGLIGLALGAAILQGVALLLKGTGTYKGLLAGLGFAQLPYIFNIPAQLLVVAGPGGAFLSLLVAFSLFIWSFALATIAVRENHGFSTGRAVATMLIPLGVAIALVVILAIALVALVAGVMTQMSAG
ncbi:MAG: Yip1 family protein [Acidimicrobiia bacterium]